MPYVLTADQIASRRQADQVDAVLQALAGVATRLPFTRTVGDEVQGLLLSPVSVVDATLILTRSGQWHVGVGLGGVEEPLPEDSRAARGPAFVAARAAVDRAKSSHQASVVAESAPDEAEDAEVLLRLLGAIRSRRTAEGWQAVDLVAEGHTQAEAAERLGVTRQAVNQRLAAANWTLERDATRVAARLLDRVDAAATSRG